jgi:hypothetical protein
VLSRRAARQKELDGLTTSVWASLHGLAVLMSRSVLPARMSSS